MCYFYLLKRKNALFVSPESNVLSCVRANAHIRSHPLHKQQGLIALLEGEKLRFYHLNGEGQEPITFPWNVTVGILWNFVMSVTTAQSFSSIQKKPSEIFHFS